MFLRDRKLSSTRENTPRLERERQLRTAEGSPCKHLSNGVNYINETEHGALSGSATLSFSIKDCYPCLKVTLRNLFDVADEYRSTYLMAKLGNNCYSGLNFEMCPKALLKEIKARRGVACALIMRCKTMVSVGISMILRFCKLIQVNSSPKKTSKQRITRCLCHTTIVRMKVRMKD